MTTALPRRSTCDFGPIAVDFDERVLAPRPWTLAQSQWAAELADRAQPGPILELCAGAGQIGLAAAVLADRDLVQVEADPRAAAYARSNALRAGFGERTEVRTTRLETALRTEERFPLIIADPPYLPTASLGRWPQDPVTAIDGGADGLDVITACLQVAGEHLSAGGSLLLQVAGPVQAEQVRRLLRSTPALSLTARQSRTIDAERAVIRAVRS